MVGIVFLCLLIIVFGFIKKRYMAKTRYVFNNEIEKFNFLEKKYTSLIGDNENIIIRTGNLFGAKERSKQSVIKKIVAKHPYEKLKPWRVFKVLEFESDPFERGFYCPLSEIGKKDKYKYIIPRSVFPKTYQSSVEIFSILDNELEDLQSYKSLYSSNYISPHSKNLIGSFNKDDSYTSDMKYIDDSKKNKINSIEINKDSNKKLIFCSECGEKEKKINSNFCKNCGNKLS